MQSEVILQVREIVDAAIAVFLVGFGLGFGTKAIYDLLVRRRRLRPATDDYETIKIRRTRPSLRNPMRTYDVRYDDFKTKRGLYEPVKPKGAEKELEV